MTAPAKLIASVSMYVMSFLIAQVTAYENIISKGFDQLLSLGFFIVATVVLWKALKQKEDELNQFKKKIIDELVEHLRNGKKD
jgi:ADP-glucose pyrophosphorylase